MNIQVQWGTNNVFVAKCITQSMSQDKYPIYCATCQGTANLVDGIKLPPGEWKRD